MINIEVKASKKLKSKESLFISFQYNLDTLNKIKSLQTRYYIADTKEWEVPASSLNEIITLFQDKQIKIKSPKAKHTEKVEQRVQYQNGQSSDFNYKTTPFAHQVEAFEYAKNVNKFLLGDEQGLGKTKQSIDIAINRRNINKFKHCLIVCGVNSVKYNWLKEIDIHSNEKGRVLGSKITKKGTLKDGSIQDRLNDLENGRDEFFLITNIESLRNKEIASKLKELTNKGIIGMTIIDEIHKAKNPTSSQGKAIHNINSYFKLALTGTPLMNKPIDLYNILKWLDVERSSLYSFRNKYCVMGGYGGYEIIGYKNLDELRQKLADNMLRRTKETSLDLPPKIRTTEYVEMSAKQDVLYREVLNGIKAKLKDITLNPNPLAQLIRLRQVTAHTSILSDLVNESAKLDRVKDIIEELAESGKKAIIFSNWEKVTSIAKEELKQYNPAYITGATKDRMAEVEKFQNDKNVKVIIGTIDAMGTGLTLTEASTVIFLDEPWNQANKEQAEDRAHRIGTKSTVNIITMICKGTIDERVSEILQEKAELMKGIVEGDETVLARLSINAGDLDRLLS